MRGALIALLIFAWMPLILFKPYIGVLLWDWVSHMNPHKQTYGFATTFPFLDFIAAMTVAGFFISSDKKHLPVHPIVIVLFVYILWIIVTTVVAFDPANATTKLIHTFKVLVFAIMAIMIMQSPNRLKAFIWIMGLSMAFIGVKGGVFTLATGGVARVEGAGGMMGDNNQLAMAMSMTVPLAIYFVGHPPAKFMKWPLLFVAICIPLSVLGTQSRGGFASLAAVLFMFLLKTKRKFTLIALAIPLAFGAYVFMPDSYKNRIESSENATEDGSFLGRVVMWKFSANLADEHPIEGGGFDVFYVQRARELFMPPGHKARAPHSIYFEVLGEHGYVGLVLFLTILFTGWYSAGTSAKNFRKHEETKWLGDLCGAIQVSLVGYAVGGLTVNIATFDYFYHLLAVVVLSTAVGNKILNGEFPTKKKEGEEVTKPKSKKWAPPRPSTNPDTSR